MNTATRPALAGKSAVEIASLVRSATVSPVDVIEEHLKRIDALEGQIHAFQTVRRERVRGEAAVLATQAGPGLMVASGEDIPDK